jgi:hypothetical protein
MADVEENNAPAAEENNAPNAEENNAPPAEDNNGPIPDNIPVTISSNDYDVVNIPVNGWGLYLALLAGSTNQRINETNLADFIEKSKEVATTISTELMKDDESSTTNRAVIDALLTKYKLAVDGSNIESLMTLSNEETDEGMKEKIQISLMFQILAKTNGLNGNIYSDGRDGKPFTDANDYLQKLLVPLSDTDAGPIARPDLFMIGRKIAQLLDISIAVFTAVAASSICTCICT